MFEVEGTHISLSRGDTGAIRFTMNAKYRGTETPYTFGERDRAVFTMKGGNGIVKQRSYQMDNNGFLLVFFNQDTDQFAAGEYNWDVRCIINPYYDEIAPGGTWTPYSKLEFPVAAGTQCNYGGVPYVAKQNIAEAEAWTASHWEEAWPDYDDLTFPVAKGDKCRHNGAYYMAKQAIADSEEWTAAHWFNGDSRIPMDGDQVITPKLPMGATLLTVVGDI